MGVAAVEEACQKAGSVDWTANVIGTNVNYCSV